MFARGLYINLLYNLPWWKCNISTRHAFILIPQDSGVGKTSVVQRFVLDSFKDGTEMTVGWVLLSLLTQLLNLLTFTWWFVWRPWYALQGIIHVKNSGSWWEVIQIPDLGYSWTRESRSSYQIHLSCLIHIMQFYHLLFNNTGFTDLLMLLLVEVCQSMHSNLMILVILRSEQSSKTQSWDGGPAASVSSICFFYLQYRSLAPMYYRGSAAAIVMYDITEEVGLVPLSTVCVWWD